MLALLIFLVYINNSGENITSRIKLFIDDCLLFRTIESVADTVDSVAETVDSVADTVNSFADTVDSVADTADSVADTVDSLLTQLTVSLTQMLFKIISVKCHSGPRNGKLFLTKKILHTPNIYNPKPTKNGLCGRCHSRACQSPSISWSRITARS